MEEVLRRLSPLNPLSPQGVDARGSAAGEPGLGGARVAGRETGGPEAPTDGAALRFVARASPNATEPGHAPPERVAQSDSPAHLALINPDAAPAVPQPIGTSPYLQTTLNTSSALLCKIRLVLPRRRSLNANDGGAHGEETGSGNPYAATRVCFG
jgi:hypothetical protein